MNKNNFKHFIKHLFLLPLFIFSLSSQAGIITITIGNGASGLTNGDIITTPTLVGIQAFQATPFDQYYGDESTSFAGSWLFNYAAIAEIILCATITIGIAEHDSQAAGDQVASYMIDGNNMTTSLNTAFESMGGADAEYNVYSLAFGAGAFAGLADGTAAAALGLQGPGLVPNLDTGGIDHSAANGAHLIFSTLTIVYDDSTTPPNPNTPVPEPSTLAIFALGMIGLASRRFKKQF